MPDASSPLLQVNNLVMHYPVKGSRAVVHAVDNVSFTLPAGQTLGLVGESGCGKSTVGRLLVGLERPTAGQILYDGQDITKMSEKELRPLRTQLQMVFQDSYSSLNPRKRVWDILAEPILFHRMEDQSTIERRIDELIDMVGLPKNARYRYPHEFSGGQRQRICIARALSLRPRFIVCDEPVSALDVSIQAQILNLLRSLQKELGLTLLFIGHGLGAVHYVSDSVAVMYMGQLVENAPADVLFRSPAHPYTRSLCQAAPVPDPAVRSFAGELLEGEVGSNTHPPAGCRFHPRCPLARPDCAQAQPELLALSQSHCVACPYYLRKGAE